MPREEHDQQVEWEHGPQWLRMEVQMEKTGFVWKSLKAQFYTDWACSES